VDNSRVKVIVVVNNLVDAEVLSMKCGELLIDVPVEMVELNDIIAVDVCDNFIWISSYRKHIPSLLL
jgi:hypothetical protein